MNKHFNIAYEVSPILAASGVFGDKSGVYRYSYCLIKYISTYLKAINSTAKIYVFTLNPFLNQNPNMDFFNLLKNENIEWIKIDIPLVERDMISGKIADIKGLRRYIRYINNLAAWFKNKSIYETYLKKIGQRLVANEVKVVHHSETAFYPFGKVKNVITIHDLIALKFPLFQKSETIDIHKRKIRFAKNYAQGIVTDSNTTKKDLIEYLSDSLSTDVSIKNIYLGAEKLDSSKQVSLRKINEILNSRKYGSIVEKKYFLYYGTLEPRKNIAFLIRAFTEFINRHPEFSEYKLLIIGGRGWGGVYEGVVSYINETYPLRNESPIIQLDFVSDEILAAIIKNAKSLVFPSSYEGFGLPVVEALQYETACIISDSPVFLELFGDNPSVKIYHNFEQLVSLMKMFAANEIKFFGSNSEYSWEKTAYTTYDFYEKLVFSKRNK